ncbi:hypothetical protein ACHHYP_20105 [Achlya hypogyna]|uniref:Uncharacterized protein n=1 Tax=Achlya hypogyna TaxID=1202772 RepID=A0A1V9Z619_ACHHY|nr:hypothetical protein ACHHYP_20105 [Achlya hypogyna]
MQLRQLKKERKACERIKALEDTNTNIAFLCNQLGDQLGACTSQLRASSAKIDQLEAKYTKEARRNELQSLAIQLLEDELRSARK